MNIGGGVSLKYPPPPHGMVVAGEAEVADRQFEEAGFGFKETVFPVAVGGDGAVASVHVERVVA